MQSNVIIPPIERLSAIVIRVLGMNPSVMHLQGTNTYLIGESYNRILIDSGEGVPSYLINMRSILEEQKCTIHTLLITHWHNDHTGGIPDIIKINPNVKIFLCDNLKQQHDYEFLPLEDGQKFQVDDTTIEAIKSPGHTEDHFTFYLNKEQAYFSGDSLLGGSSTVIKHLKPYLDSLKRALDFSIQRIYTGHGFYFDGMDTCRLGIQNQIKHRLNREAQILQALKSLENHKATIEMLVPLVYPELIDTTLIRVAKMNLQVHLEKLQEDKIVTQIVDDYYQLIQ